jgi:hypothetical protein
MESEFILEHGLNFDVLQEMTTTEVLNLQNEMGDVLRE